MKMRKFMSLFLVAAMTLSVCAGCSGKQEAPTEEKTEEAENEAEAPEEEAGESVFTQAIAYMPSALQPSSQSSDDLVKCTRPIYECLFAETVDGLETYLADSLEISDDGLTYTVKLNQDATWSDGVPVTVDDIMFTIDYGVFYRGGMPTSFTAVNGQEVQFNKVDDKTLEITLPSVYDNYVRTLAQFYPMPAHAFDGDVSKVDDSGYFTTPDMVTNGAYVVSEFNADSIVYKARDDYYRGKPTIDTLVMRTLGAGQTTQIAFENGEIDYMRITTAEDYEKYCNNDQYNTYSVSEARLNYLQLNPNSPVLSELGDDARKAIFLALNAQQIVDGAWGRDALANSLITPDQAIYNPDCKGYEFNLEEAKKLAESSGLSGKTLTYVYNSSRSNMEDVAIIIQQELAAIGVTVNVEGCDTSTFFPRFFASDDSELAPTWDLGTNGWDSQRGNNCGQAISYFTNRLCNCGYSDALSAKAVQAMGTADQDAKKALWYEIQDEALAEYREYPLTYTNYVMVSQKNVTGLDNSTVIPEFIDYLGISVN